MRVRENYAPQWVIDAVTSGGGNDVLYVTIHETANRSAGADANAHARLQAGGNSRSASWHEQVDEDEAVLSFRENIQCWAAGDGGGNGNMESYHIEICVNSDGDYVQACKNAAKRAAYRLHRNGRSISRLVQHHRWSGKDCPNLMREGYRGVTWSKFKGWVDDEMDRLAGGGDSSKPDNDKNVEVDGKIGTNSIEWTQRRLAEVDLYSGPFDGEIDHQNPYWKDENEGFTSGWDWDPNFRKHDGSPTIHGLHAVITAKGIDAGPDDGLVGPQFNAGFQTYLTEYAKYDERIDGEFWYEGTAAKSWQKVLNSKRGFNR